MKGPTEAFAELARARTLSLRRLVSGRGKKDPVWAFSGRSSSVPLFFYPGNLLQRGSIKSTIKCLKPCSLRLEDVLYFSSRAHRNTNLWGELEAFIHSFIRSGDRAVL